MKPTPANVVLGPDILLAHSVVTVKVPGGYESMVFRAAFPCAAVDEVLNDNWESALIAHAIMWEACKNLEKKARMWTCRETPTTPKKEAS